MLRFEITQNGKARDVKMEGDDLVIGRRNERTAVGLDLTPDEMVSRIHARVWRDAGEVRIEDLGSRAGTFVNGEKLEQSQVLRPGEVVTLGETQITLKGALPDRRKRNAPSGTRNPKRKRPLKPRPKPAGLNEPEPLPGNAKVGLHIELTFDGKTRLDVFDRDEIFIGRKHPEVDISLDLSGDLLESRTHARIWQTRGICWVEDLGSTHGTLVNGGAIDGACVVNTADKVQIGSTLLRVWHVATTTPVAPVVQPTDARVEQPEAKPKPDKNEITKKSSLPKIAGVAVVIICMIGLGLWLFVFHSTSSAPRSRDEIFREKVNLPALYFTADKKQRVVASGEQGNFVDKDTGEICWRAFECRNPKCPGKAANGGLHLFITPDPAVFLKPDGTLGFDEKKANEAVRSGKVGGCPECLKIRNLKSESPATRERYASFVQTHVLPETTKRLKELEEEYKRNVEIDGK